MTSAVSKQLLPVAGRPMIYFPLATLMLAGIRDIVLVCSPNSQKSLELLLGSGSQLGIEIQYRTQLEPKGVAHGFGMASDLNLKSATLAVLGDNFFFGPKFGSSLVKLVREAENTTVFAKKSSSPSQFGVLDFDSNGTLVGFEEKPSKPPSNLVATGLYYFKPGDLSSTRIIKPSKRGEQEITDLLNNILRQDAVDVVEIPRSTYWSDLGTSNEIRLASNYVESIESSQGHGVLLPEVIAFRNGWISFSSLERIVADFPNTRYKELIEIELRDIL